MDSGKRGSSAGVLLPHTPSPPSLECPGQVESACASLETPLYVEVVSSHCYMYNRMNVQMHVYIHVHVHVCMCMCVRMR